MTCEFPNCGKPVLAKKLCRGHYEQQRDGKALTRLELQGDAGSACPPVDTQAQVVRQWFTPAPECE